MKSGTWGSDLVDTSKFNSLKATKGATEGSVPETGESGPEGAHVLEYGGGGGGVQ